MSYCLTLYQSICISIFSKVLFQNAFLNLIMKNNFVKYDDAMKIQVQHSDGKLIL